MQRLKQLEESGGFDIENVFFVLISVDGDRDSPDVPKGISTAIFRSVCWIDREAGTRKNDRKIFFRPRFSEAPLQMTMEIILSHTRPKFSLWILPVTYVQNSINASTAAMKGVILKLFKEMQDPAEPLK